MTEKSKEGEISAFSSFHLEADRCRDGMRMFVSGVIGIGGYSTEEILLRSHGCKVRISGSRLKICVYENNTVEVVGRIGETEFTYGKG